MRAGEGSWGEGKDLVYRYQRVTEVRELEGNETRPIVCPLADLEQHDLSNKSR